MLTDNNNAIHGESKFGQLEECCTIVSTKQHKRCHQSRLKYAVSGRRGDLTKKKEIHVNTTKVID